MKESEHMRLICPVMTEFVANALNGNPFCAGSACALWRWTDNSRPYPDGERPGRCGLVKENAT